VGLLSEDIIAFRQTADKIHKDLKYRPMNAHLHGQLQEQVLERTTALARVGGDLDLLKEIAELFLDEYPRVLDDIRKALATGDAPLLERSAHGLKGSVANFGARAAVDAAFELEQLGKAGKLDRVPPALAALERALACLHAELSAIES
jgi:two-component system sensor histidine kinase/response regulator